MDISELQKKVIEFRDARDWAQYHNPKDLAISLSFAFARIARPGILCSSLKRGSAFAKASARQNGEVTSPSCRGDALRSRKIVRTLAGKASAQFRSRYFELAAGSFTGGGRAARDISVERRPGSGGDQTRSGESWESKRRTWRYLDLCSEHMPWLWV